MSQKITCHACQTSFPLDPEMLHPYRDGLIQGQRLPRYWVCCPNCDQKNVIELIGASGVIVGKPSAH
jgi:hypothetical protein